LIPPTPLDKGDYIPICKRVPLFKGDAIGRGIELLEIERDMYTVAFISGGSRKRGDQSMQYSRFNFSKKGVKTELGFLAG
jgi:hypothetical protein